MSYSSKVFKLDNTVHRFNFIQKQVDGNLSIQCYRKFFSKYTCICFLSVQFQQYISGDKTYVPCVITNLF